MSQERPNIKLYLATFAGLLALSAASVLVSALHLPRAQAVSLGLLIAGVQACLGGMIFMHLWGEHRAIHLLLYITAFFAALVLTIPVLGGRWSVPKLLHPVAVADQHPEEAAPQAPAAAP